MHKMKRNNVFKKKTKLQEKPILVIQSLLEAVEQATP